MGETTVYQCPKDPTKKIGNRGSCVARSRNEKIPECFGCPGPKKVMQASVLPSAKQKEHIQHPPHKETKEKVVVSKPGDVLTSPTVVKCKTDGCEKKLRQNNTTGFCRTHAKYAARYRPAPPPRQTEGWDNRTKGYGTTGLCQSCVCRENAKKTNSPAAKKKRAETYKRNKEIIKSAANDNANHEDTKIKTCKEFACEHVFSPNNKNGYCKGHSGGKYSLTKKSKDPTVIQVDFSDFPEILKALETIAKEEIRSPEGQVLYILKKQLTNHSESSSR